MSQWETQERKTNWGTSSGRPRVHRQGDCSRQVRQEHQHWQDWEALCSLRVRQEDVRSSWTPITTPLSAPTKPPSEWSSLYLPRSNLFTRHAPIILDCSKEDGPHLPLFWTEYIVQWQKKSQRDLEGAIQRKLFLLRNLCLLGRYYCRHCGNYVLHRSDKCWVWWRSLYRDYKHGNRNKTSFLLISILKRWKTKHSSYNIL